MKERKFPATYVTVIFRDNSPMVRHNDNFPSFRRVTITLTPEQRKQLEVKFTHTSGGSDRYEGISQCFLEGK